MNCPSCGTDTYTKETRRPSGQRFTRRRRECPSCGERFTTKEIPAQDLKIILKEVQRLRKAYEARTAAGVGA